MEGISTSRYLKLLKQYKGIVGGEIGASPETYYRKVRQGRIRKGKSIQYKNRQNNVINYDLAIETLKVLADEVDEKPDIKVFKTLWDNIDKPLTTP